MISKKKIIELIVLVLVFFVVIGCGLGVSPYSLEENLNIVENKLYDVVRIPGPSQWAMRADICYLFIHEDLLLSFIHTGDLYYSYAEIADDGSLGEWAEMVTLLNDADAVPGRVIGYHDGRLYFFKTKSSYCMGEVGEDGTIGTIAFIEDSGPPNAIDLEANVAFSDDTVYITGGDRDNPSSALYYAHIESDGSLSGWETGPEFSEGRWGHGSEVIDNYLYVFGGCGGWNSPLLSDIQRTALEEDDTPSTWEEVGTLPSIYSEFCHCVHSGKLFVYLGNISTNATDPSFLFWTDITTTGDLTDWKIGRDQLRQKLSETSTSLTYIFEGYQGRSAVWGQYVYNIQWESNTIIRGTVME